jgi:hypothetical protein
MGFLSAFLTPRALIGLGASIAVALLLAWGLRVDHLRAGWKHQTEVITSAVATAADLRTLAPADAPRIVAQLAGNLRTCRENGARLEAGVAAQNVAVDALQRDGAARIAALDHAAAASRQAAQTAQERANAILAHRGTGDHCADAEALIRENVQ